MDEAPLSVSVVILTSNSAQRLEDCLKSVDWADEIIVLDNGSIDQTLSIAKQFTDRIVQQPVELIAKHRGNFDIARNYGFELAKSSWIFSLDSDEVVSEELGKEILRVVAEDRSEAFFVPRINLYWNKPVRLLGKDYQMRLFRKGSVRYVGNFLDTRPEVTGEIAHLNSPLVHYSIDSLSQYIRKLATRTSIRAEALRGSSAQPKLLSALSGFCRTFGFYYLKQQAFRDGIYGLWVCFLYALDPVLTSFKSGGRPAR